MPLNTGILQPNTGSLSPLITAVLQVQSENLESKFGEQDLQPAERAPCLKLSHTHSIKVFHHQHGLPGLNMGSNQRSVPQEGYRPWTPRPPLYSVPPKNFPCASSKKCHPLTCTETCSCPKGHGCAAVEETQLPCIQQNECPRPTVQVSCLSVTRPMALPHHQQLSIQRHTTHPNWLRSHLAINS